MCYFLTSILLILTTAGVGGQTVNLEPLQRNTTCSEGLRAGADTYLINGTIKQNVTALIDLGWEYAMTSTVSTNASQFVVICPINIGRTGGFCVSQSTDPCYCDQFDATTGFVHFVINYVAQLKYSQGTLRVEWRHTNGTKVYSVQNINLPAIYDVNAADLTLTVNGHPTVETNGFCDSNFTAGAKYTFQLCCNKTASPCYPRIDFNGVIVAESQSGCVNYTYKYDDQLGVTMTMTPLYSVCTKTNYIKRSSCIISAGTGTTTLPPSKNDTGVNNTTETPTNSSSPNDHGHTESDGSNSQPTIIASVFGSAGIILVAGGISFFVINRYKKQQQRNKDKTNEENPESGGTERPGAAQPENTSNTGANRPRNDTSASGAQNVELNDIPTKKKDGDVFKNGQTKVDPNIDVPHSAKRPKNATGGSELQSEESKDIQTKKKEAPSSKTGQTSAKGQRDLPPLRGRDLPPLRNPGKASVRHVDKFVKTENTKMSIQNETRTSEREHKGIE